MGLLILVPKGLFLGGVERNNGDISSRIVGNIKYNGGELSHSKELPIKDSSYLLKKQIKIK